MRFAEAFLLAEVQQSSDLTYRIYDYNRPGIDGKPRELHTELAAEALNYHVEKTIVHTILTRKSAIVRCFQQNISLYISLTPLPHSTAISWNMTALSL